MNITIRPRDDTKFLGDLPNGSFFENEGDVYIVTGHSSQFQVHTFAVLLRDAKEAALVSEVRVRELKLVDVTFE